MDKIYSRKRIKLPKFSFKKNNNINNDDVSYILKKIIKIFWIIIIAILVFEKIKKNIEPIIEKECMVKAKSIATEISNREASIVMKKYKYDDVCNVIKDEQKNIKMIKTNIITVNEITSEVALGIQNELNKLQSENIYISVGNFTGIIFFLGRGPKISFKIMKLGNVETNLKSEFISEGINQTIHKIFLQVDCTVAIVTPFGQIEDKITNQVLIAEAVILGNVPNSYYNLEGVKQDNLIDIIE